MVLRLRCVSWFLEHHQGHGYEHCGCGAVAGVNDDYPEQAPARAGEKHEGADWREYAHRGEQGGDFDYYQKNLEPSRKSFILLLPTRRYLWARRPGCSQLGFSCLDHPGPPAHGGLPSPGDQSSHFPSSSSGFKKIHLS